MESPIRVLMIAGSWPEPGQPRTTYCGKRQADFIKRQAEFLRAAGVEVVVLPPPGGKKLGNYVRAWVQVQRQLSTEHFDLVHAQFGPSGLLALPKRLPLVVTFRDNDLLGIQRENGRAVLSGKLRQRLSWAVACRANAVIVESSHMKPYLDPSVPVHVIPSGLDFDLFRAIPQRDARRYLGLPPDRRLILFAGNPADPRKRYALSRRAVEILRESCAAELVIAWDVPHTDMPYYMNACDVLVFTSMQEGSPNVVKEALACNLPVVSVVVGDVGDRLRGVEGCALCPDERPQTIASALERVLQRGRRVNGREAVKDLDERLLTQQTIVIYRSAMANARHPRHALAYPRAP